MDPIQKAIMNYCCGDEESSPIITNEGIGDININGMPLNRRLGNITVAQLKDEKYMNKLMSDMRNTKDKQYNSMLFDSLLDLVAVISMLTLIGLPFGIYIEFALKEAIPNSTEQEKERYIKKLDKIISSTERKIKMARSDEEKKAAQDLLKILKSNKSKLISVKGKKEDKPKSVSSNPIHNKYEGTDLYYLSCLRALEVGDMDIDDYLEKKYEWKNNKNFTVLSLYDYEPEAIGYFKVSVTQIEKYFKDQKAKGIKPDSDKYANDYVLGEPLESFFRKNELWELIGDGSGNCLLYNVTDKKCYYYDHEFSYNKTNLGNGISLSKIISDSTLFYRECEKLVKEAK